MNTAHLWAYSALPFWVLATFCRRWFTPAWIFLLMLLAGFFFIGADVLYFIDDWRHGRAGGMAIDAGLIALWVWIVWNEWNKWKNDRKRIKALLGAKSRELRDRLVRRQAEQGAGA